MSAVPIGVRRVLVVAYYFPPLGGIGSVRAVKLAKYLPDYSWIPTVLAPRAGAYYRDPSLVFPEDHVVRTGSLEMSRLGKRVIGSPAGDTRQVETGPFLARLRALVRRWVYVPDAQVGWYPFALTAARKILREQHFDAILSSSFPITAHLVGRRLASDFGLPWVAEFRDVWTDRTSYDSPWRATVDRAIETSILDRASIVVTVSDSWARLLRSRGAERVEVVTNGFDPHDFSQVQVPPALVATFLGTFYSGQQDLGTALRALEVLRSTERPSLRVRFVGNRPRGVEDALAPLGKAVECTGFVARTEALRLLSRSSLLILAGSALADAVSRGIIPAKVFEYLGSRRPILYVGRPDADVARLLQGHAGVRIVSPGDVPAAIEAARGLIDGGAAPLRRYLEPLTHRFLAGRLAGVLNDSVQP